MTTSVLRSGWSTLTCSSGRRLLSRQLTLRTWSPGVYGRTSANSMPSPRRRRAQLHLKLDVVTLEHALGRQAHRTRELGIAHDDEGKNGRDQERRHEQHRLRSSEEGTCDQPGGAENEVGAKARRRPPGHG